MHEPYAWFPLLISSHEILFQGRKGLFLLLFLTQTSQTSYLQTSQSQTSFHTRRLHFIRIDFYRLVADFFCRSQTRFPGRRLPFAAVRRLPFIVTDQMLADTFRRLRKLTPFILSDIILTKSGYTLILLSSNIHPSLFITSDLSPCWYTRYWAIVILLTITSSPVLYFWPLVPSLWLQALCLWPQVLW